MNNEEAFASELIENLEEMCFQYYIYSGVCGVQIFNHVIVCYPPLKG